MSETTQNAPTCARHPKVVTYITCARCGTPICPDCFVESPVGFKCRDCGRAKAPNRLRLMPWHYLLVLVIGLLGGMIAGAIGGILGFFTIWLAIPFGRGVGWLILRAARRQGGLAVQIFTGVSIMLGGLLPMAWRLIHWPLTAHLSAGSLFVVIAIIICAASAVSRVRYSWGWGGL